MMICFYLNYASGIRRESSVRSFKKIKKQKKKIFGKGIHGALYEGTRGAQGYYMIIYVCMKRDGMTTVIRRKNQRKNCIH